MNTFTKPPKIKFLKTLLLIITGLFFWSIGTAQTISGQINIYTAVTAPGNCPNKLSVSDTTGFRPNDKVLVIQIQGATIDESNSGSFGEITYNGAGLYEKATIATVDGNEITFYKDLVNFYDPTTSSVQLVNIPQYTDVTISGTLVAAPWNGATGGVLAFEASGTVTLNANISVDGLGFRGGAITNDPDNNNNCGPLDRRDAYFYNENSLFSAFKGEGIAQVISGKELGRGPQANGGGGGNDHNSGGAGGGGNGLGGNGGRNNEPGIIRCKGQYPGIGGKTVNETGRIFFGGGGGGGHSNNNSGSAGGNGGGIIYIHANTFDGNGRTISANGIAAQNGVGDGVGGGGAGGTILLKVDNSNFTTDLLTAQANGGNGASVDNLNDNRCFGPGGGGGGGIIAITTDPSNDPVQKSALGGIAGITFNTRNGCEGSTNGASAGDPGTITDLVIIPEGTQIPEVSCNPLPVDFVSFTATLLSGKVQLNWVTGSETNNEYFSIERSENGQQFVQLARITGKGTYTALSSYQTIDPNPLAGVSYYRIRQVDYDGKFSYSKTVSIENQEAGLAVSLFPNPVQHSRSFFLKIASPVTETLHLQIVNTLGEAVLTRGEILQSGTNTFEINMPDLPAGMYLVQIRSGNSFKVLRLQLL